MKPLEIFTPSWKENGNEQYSFSNGEWIKCGESCVNSLWQIWVVSPNASTDEENGFSIYGFSNP